MSRKRALPPGDGSELFRAAVADAKPLPGRARKVRAAAAPEPAREPAREPVPAVAPSVPRSPAPPGPSRRAAPPREDLTAQSGAHPDRATAERLRRGLMPVEATLDLHGMTLARAEPALAAFLAQEQARGRRLVLVVTGKGTRVDRETGRVVEGAIRREFPHWLNQERNRARIVAFRAANARHGGAGPLFGVLKQLKWG